MANFPLPHNNNDIESFGNKEYIFDSSIGGQGAWLKRNKVDGTKALTIDANNATGVKVKSGAGVTIDSADGLQVDTGVLEFIKQETLTISPTDISNGYAVLSAVPKTASNVFAIVIGGPTQEFGVDFTIQVNNQFTWAGNLAGLISSGDKIIVRYT